MTAACPPFPTLPTHSHSHTSAHLPPNNLFLQAGLPGAAASFYPIIPYKYIIFTLLCRCFYPLPPSLTRSFFFFFSFIFSSFPSDTAPRFVCQRSRSVTAASEPLTGFNVLYDYYHCCCCCWWCYYYDDDDARYYCDPPPGE